MTYDPQVLNATQEEKSAAFQWLRGVAISGGDDWRDAAIMLEEIARLGAMHAPEANAQMILDALIEGHVDTTIDEYTPPKLRALLECIQPQMGEE